MSKRRKYEPITDYLDFTDLIKKAGYKVYEPKLGNVGRALIKASKAHRSIGWLRNQLEGCLKKQQKNKKDRNDKKKNDS